MQNPLHSLPKSHPDPIFAIGEAAKSAGPGAINGTVGMIMDEDGKPLVLGAVKRAAADIGRELSSRSFAYPHLLGLPEFRQEVARMIFGNAPTSLASIATIGGTGAVGINLRLTKLLRPDIPVILPGPSWQNHRQLIDGAGMTLMEVPYLENGVPTTEPIVKAVQKIDGPATLLLQVGCHNPTGLDFAHTQWEELADALRDTQAIALLDIAYQGFSEGVAEDPSPIRLFVERGVTTLVAWSASKNHTLYSERVGMACAIAEDEAMKTELEQHYMILTRGVHSAASTIGQAIVARTQIQYRKPWDDDVAELRTTLKKKREKLLNELPTRFHKSLAGNGMFAQLPLSRDEVRQLRTQNVFLTDDGRINIAGIPMKRVNELCEKICDITV